MITITIGNSYSNIKGLSPSEEKDLRKALSYVVGGKSAHFSKYGPKYKSLLDKKGNFPSGLIGRIVHQFCNDDIKFIYATAPKCIVGALPKLPGYYRWQIDAVNQALLSGKGIISAPTGTGKSRAMQLLCETMNLKTLIIVPTIEVKKQLLSVMGELLNVINNITVENIDNPALKYMTDFDCLIIDEAHHSAAKTYHKLNKTAWINIYHRFFFTATPFRNDTEETLLFEAIAGQVIYQLPYKVAVKEKYIVPVEAYYFETEKQKTDAFTWKEVYSELVVHNDKRNNQIGALLLRLKKENRFTLCLVKEVAHGKKLAALTGLPFVHSEDEESRKYIQEFNEGKIKALIGTEGILGEGVDTKPCEYVVIAGLGKAKSALMQKIGRSVRTYPGKDSAKVILISDKSHKFTRRHFSQQSAILQEEYGVKPMRIDL